MIGLAFRSVSRVLIPFTVFVDRMRSSVYERARISKVVVGRPARTGWAAPCRFVPRSAERPLMTFIETSADERREHPVDVVERSGRRQRVGLRSRRDGRDFDPGLRPVRQLRRRLHLAAGPRIAACELFVRSQDAPAQTRGDRRTDATHQRTIVARAFRPVEPAGRGDVSPRFVPRGGRAARATRNAARWSRRRSTPARPIIRRSSSCCGRIAARARRSPSPRSRPGRSGAA